MALKEAAEEEEDDEDSDDDEINWDDDDYEMCEVPRGYVEQIPMYPSSDQYTPSLIDRASLYSRANQFDSDPPNTPRAITAEMASGAVTALSSEYEILSQPSSSREVTSSISELNISPSREIETPPLRPPIQIDPRRPHARTCTDSHPFFRRFAPVPVLIDHCHPSWRSHFHRRHITSTLPHHCRGHPSSR